METPSSKPARAVKFVARCPPGLSAEEFARAFNAVAFGPTDGCGGTYFAMKQHFADKAHADRRAAASSGTSV